MSPQVLLERLNHLDECLDEAKVDMRRWQDTMEKRVRQVEDFQLKLRTQIALLIAAATAVVTLVELSSHWMGRK